MNCQKAAPEISKSGMRFPRLPARPADWPDENTVAMLKDRVDEEDAGKSFSK